MTEGSSKLTRRGFVAVGAAVLATPAIVTSAAAQDVWPSKPLRIVVPYTTGGQTDVIGRAIGKFLSLKFGQPAVVDNKSGAGGTIGVNEVKRAAPDGYTILCTISSSLIQTRATVKNLPYDPVRDFIYLTMTTGLGGPVVAAEGTGVTNLKELVEYAKKHDKLNWGAYGIGSTGHILIAALAKQYGLKFEAVQYRGEAAMWADLAAQTLDAAVGSYAGALPVIQSGRGRVFAIMGERMPPFPDIPTLVEQGAVGDFHETRAFTVFAVPAGTPPDIVTKLSDAMIEAGTDADVKRLLESYLIRSPLSFEATNARFKRDSEVMMAVMKDLGINPE